jgi:hypothetical protein
MTGKYTIELCRAREETEYEIAISHRPSAGA